VFTVTALDQTAYIVTSQNDVTVTFNLVHIIRYSCKHCYILTL